MFAEVLAKMSETLFFDNVCVGVVYSMYRRGQLKIVTDTVQTSLLFKKSDSFDWKLSRNFQSGDNPNGLYLTQYLGNTLFPVGKFIHMFTTSENAHEQYICQPHLVHDYFPVRIISLKHRRKLWRTFFLTPCSHYGYTPVRAHLRVVSTAVYGFLEDVWAALFSWTMFQFHKQTRGCRTVVFITDMFRDRSVSVGYWHCPHNIRSRVYVTVRCPSIRPSVSFIDRCNSVRRVCCWASGHRIHWLIAAPARARSNKCGQRHVDSWRRKLNTVTGTFIERRLGTHSGFVWRCSSFLGRNIWPPAVVL